MKLSSGTVIQSYTISHQIGEGGMGEVYLAQEIHLGLQVAIKRLNPSLANDPQFSQRFINEARIQAQLHHPNIIRFYYFFEEAGMYYMVMEYAQGSTLKELIQNTGLLPEARALHIFQQILQALAYAHQKQIIHRDVKPSNIIIDSDYSVKVMDFGIARLLSDNHLTRTGAKMGTLYYMSPEQVLADKNVDHRTDIYSLGIVLYEMLTGKLPFNSDTNSDFVIMRDIVSNVLPDPRTIYSHISAQAVQLITELTAKEKEKRPDSDRILQILKPIPTPKPVIVPPAPVAIIEPEESNTQIIDIPDDLKGADSKNKGKAFSYAMLFWFWLLLIPLIILLFTLLYKPSKSDVAEDAIIEEVAPLADFVYVSGGTFNNGTSSVTLSSFYIDKYEVTQCSYEDVMDSNPVNSSGVGSNYPVSNISWFKAIQYCNRRSIQEGLTPSYSYSSYGTDPSTWPAGWYADDNHTNVSCNWAATGYRLPTEMEWMFAAMGGNQSKGYTYSGSNAINEVTWYKSNSESTTHKVATKVANELGLYDMSGNELEWCWDIYDSFPSGSQNNPKGANSGSTRVLRGGSWVDGANVCSVSFREIDVAACSYYYFVFRCVRSSP